MNVRFAGRHVGIAEEDRDYALRKAQSLARFHRNLRELEVRVERDGTMMERVELEAGIGRQHRAVAAAEAPEFRRAFDGAVEGLRKQLLKDKEKVVDRRRRASARRRSS